MCGGSQVSVASVQHLRRVRLLLCVTVRSPPALTVLRTVPLQIPGDVLRFYDGSRTGDHVCAGVRQGNCRVPDHVLGPQLGDGRAVQGAGAQLRLVNVTLPLCVTVARCLLSSRSEPCLTPLT